MKRLLPLCLLTFSWLYAQPTPEATLPEGVDEEFLVQSMRHLYRWVLDERDAEKIVGQKAFPFWIGEKKLELDPGDRSRVIEIMLPALGLSFTARKADYPVPELNLHVKNEGFRIRDIQRMDETQTPPPGYATVTLSFEDMIRRGTQQREADRFPEGDFLNKIRQSARKEFLAEARDRNLPLPKGDQQVFLAPLSPVSNELWVFWETGGMLLRISSDMDLQDPKVWQKEDLNVDLYHIKEQTVVSLKEVPGSNAYMTRDQVGRYLFNCIILGKRLVLTPP